MAATYLSEQTFHEIDPARCPRHLAVRQVMEIRLIQHPAPLIQAACNFRDTTNDLG
jgi:hypothetical protein